MGKPIALTDAEIESGFGQASDRGGMSERSASADTAGISELSASVGGGPHGPWFEVQMHRTSLQYFAMFGHENVQPLVTPSHEQWIEFRRTLDAIDVSRWRKEYAEPHVMDGTSWSVRLVIDGRTVESNGSNQYPPGFECFRAALEALLGGQEFR